MTTIRTGKAGWIVLGIVIFGVLYNLVNSLSISGLPGLAAWQNWIPFYTTFSGGLSPLSILLAAGLVILPAILLYGAFRTWKDGGKAKVPKGAFAVFAALASLLLFFFLLMGEERATRLLGSGVTWFYNLVDGTTTPGAPASSWSSQEMWFALAAAALLGIGIWLKSSLAVILAVLMALAVATDTVNFSDGGSASAVRTNGVTLPACADGWSAPVTVNRRGFDWSWTVQAQYQRNGVWHDHMSGTSPDSERMRFCATLSEHVGQEMPIHWR